MTVPSKNSSGDSPTPPASPHHTPSCSPPRSSSWPPRRSRVRTPNESCWGQLGIFRQASFLWVRRRRTITASGRCRVSIDMAALVQPRGLSRPFAGNSRPQTRFGQTRFGHRFAHILTQTRFTRSSGPPVPGLLTHPRLKSRAMRIHPIFLRRCRTGRCRRARCQ